MTVFIVVFFSSVHHSYATNNFSLYSLQEEPFGISYANWTIQWWKWLQETPKSQNPSIDTTGEHCNVNQPKEVFFLTGALQGEADRKCEIPFGKPLFFAHGYECSDKEYPQYKTYDALLKCAQDELPKFIDPSKFIARIDGQLITNLTEYRVLTPPFEVNFPKDNIWGVSEGISKEAAETYFLFLKPLEKGKHVLEFGSMSTPAQLSNYIPAHAFDIKYEIVIR